MDLLACSVKLSYLSSYRSDFARDLVGDRYFLSHPARYSPCRVGDRLDEDLVPSDTLHHPRCSPYTELRAGLAILGYECLIKHADGRVCILFDDEVLFLVRYHGELVEVVRVEVFDSRRPHHHLVLLRNPGEARKTRVHVVRNGSDIVFRHVSIWIRLRYQFNKLVVVPFSVLYQESCKLVAERVERFFRNRHFLQVLTEGPSGYHECFESIVRVACYDHSISHLANAMA